MNLRQVATRGEHQKLMKKKKTAVIITNKIWGLVSTFFYQNVLTCKQYDSIEKHKQIETNN